MLVFDNVAVQHGRQPWDGEQIDPVVFANLWDGETPGKYEGSEDDWAQVVQATGS